MENHLWYVKKRLLHKPFAELVSCVGEVRRIEEPPHVMVEEKQIKLA